VVQVSFLVVGARELAARLLAKAATLDAELEVTLKRNAQAALQRVRQRAPVRTGRYRDSWHVERDGRGSYVVATDEPYGRRLEYGFVGTDALGRHYAQAPRPHLNPAADETEGPFVRDVGRDLVRGL
jgi:hypothetical protein